jgi:histidinol-phosphate phosphatase family protein
MNVRRIPRPTIQFQDPIAAYLEGMIDAIRGVDPSQVAACFDALWSAWEQDRTVFIIGNGGSASTASHMANDLTKQTHVPGRKPLRAHALTDSVEAITAIANDTGYENTFATQLRTFARTGDLLILISASGNSPNIVKAIEVSQRLGLVTIAFGGLDGGRTRDLSDHYVHVPSYDYGHVETAHLLIEHLLTKVLLDVARGATKPAVLVDRDGVLVRNRDDYVKTLSEMEILPGALEALAVLAKKEHRVFVVTNQSAIGRGLTTHAKVDRMHSHLARQVQRVGGKIEAFLVCPHTPEDGCDCRKPAPGLLFQARDRYGVDLDSAVMIGDWDTDTRAARAAGCTSILVMNGRAGHSAVHEADHTVNDISEAVELIVSRNGSLRVRR